MPLIFAGILMFVVIFIIIAFAIPMCAMFLATSLIGRSAKFTDREIIYLRFFYYGVTGLLIGLTIGVSGYSGPISFVFNVLLGGLIWPLGLFLEMTGSFEGDEGSSAVFYMSVFLGFVFTQIKAVRMILKRADDATNLEEE